MRSSLKLCSAANFSSTLPIFRWLAFCVAAGIVAGLIFAVLNGWPAYLAAGALLIAAHATPFLLFRQGIVFPYFAPMASAWLTVAAAASYQHFVVRAGVARV